MPTMVFSMGSVVWFLGYDRVLDFFANLDEEEHQEKESDGCQDVGGIEHGVVG